jgi:peptidoglycan/LPS O-acetylase OafA/YrhL
VKLHAKVMPHAPGLANPNLDLLRAVAVLTVYFSHILQMLGVEHIGLYSLNALGQSGVLVFFVHTSLVLMFSLERSSIRRNWISAFYLRRAFRIYPLSIFAVVCTVVLAIPPRPLDSYRWLGWHDFASNIGLMQNLTYSENALGPLWSLPLEVQMYVVLPALFLLTRALRRAWAAILILWLLSVGVALTPLAHGRLSLLQYVPCFLGGVLAYSLRLIKPRMAWYGWPLVIIAAYAIRGLGMRAGWVSCLLLGFAIPWFAPIGAGWVRSASGIIARYSYGVYLSHIPIFWLCFVKLQVPPAAQVTLCAALSMAIPAALFHAIEEPFIRIGQNISGR